MINSAIVATLVRKQWTYSMQLCDYWRLCGQNWVYNQNFPNCLQKPFPNGSKRVCLLRRNPVYLGLIGAPYFLSPAGTYGNTETIVSLFRERKDPLQRCTVSIEHGILSPLDLGRAKTLIEFLKDIGWTPPQIGWIKLNTNGLPKGNPGVARSGDILRDSQGNWLKGYAQNLSNTTNSAAKLWGLRDGLFIAKSLGVKKLEIETNTSLVSALTNQNLSNIHLFFLSLSNCRQMMTIFSEVRVAHV